MNKKNISKVTFVLSLIFIVIGYILPYDSLEFIFGQGLRPLGLVSLYINPILGLIGVLYSVINKQWILLVLNIISIFSFFIIMYIGYAV